MFALGSGALAAVLMVLLLFVSDLLIVPKQATWTRPVRYLANGTFTIYLMHYPLLVLAAGLGLLRVDRPWGNVTVSVVICIALIPVASASDRFKDLLRGQLRRVFPA